MKLKIALELGKQCELSTVAESILNIRIHAMNIFAYGEEAKEYRELLEDFKLSGCEQDDKIEDVLAKLS